jgi:polyhydroxyalkanoate synthesis regulator phasin
VALRSTLKQQALGLSAKAMERLMSDEKRAMKIANAIGSVQRGKQALDRGQDELMKALNLATKSDFKAVGKRLSSLKRRLRDLEDKLGQA